ncbi:hypothetical protein DBR32_09915 [Taibaiella sp. KBW10]|uniref:DUF3820 family protein n=1 Tax=Taibaiella sp. KBW10 TaxID=2153357 RepID=UPI000F59CE4E|nr:DUF3820 family protein [Taibaiella sp. KBW10]RQO31014.1 hypothetical protein DBR32_09915 [Taibaiella sp. KBW10]
MEPNPELLTELFELRMPFGKYKGTLIGDLPEAYILWFNRQGFPKGKLGLLLQTMYEIKLNGLSFLLDPIRKSKTKG